LFLLMQVRQHAIATSSSVLRGENVDFGDRPVESLKRWRAVGYEAKSRRILFKALLRSADGVISQFVRDLGAQTAALIGREHHASSKLVVCPSGWYVSLQAQRIDHFQADLRQPL